VHHVHHVHQVHGIESAVARVLTSYSPSLHSDMPKKTKIIPTYTETISVRLSVPEAQRLYDLAATGRRTLSQTVRLLLESVLNAQGRASTEAI
jgi:hypothetical protein